MLCFFQVLLLLKLLYILKMTPLGNANEKRQNIEFTLLRFKQQKKSHSVVTTFSPSKQQTIKGKFKSVKGSGATG